jgi:hypothetical protein
MLLTHLISLNETYSAYHVLTLLYNEQFLINYRVQTGAEAHPAS